MYAPGQIVYYFDRQELNEAYIYNDENSEIYDVNGEIIFNIPNGISKSSYKNNISIINKSDIFPKSMIHKGRKIPLYNPDNKPIKDIKNSICEKRLKFLKKERDNKILEIYKIKRRLQESELEIREFIKKEMETSSITFWELI